MDTIFLKPTERSGTVLVHGVVPRLGGHAWIIRADGVPYDPIFNLRISFEGAKIEREYTAQQARQNLEMFHHCGPWHGFSCCMAAISRTENWQRR